MKPYKWHSVVAISLLIILQPFLSQWFEIRNVSINFVLYFVMLFAFTKKPSQSFTFAVVIGLIYDMVYSLWLGKMIILLLAATALVMILDKRIYRENIPALTVFFLFSTFILENLNTLLEVGLSDFLSNFVYIQGNLVWIAVYAAILSIITGAFYFVLSLKGDRRVSMKGTS